MYILIAILCIKSYIFCRLRKKREKSGLATSIELTKFNTDGTCENDTECGLSSVEPAIVEFPEDT